MKRRTLKKRAMRAVREQERDWKRLRGRHDRTQWLVRPIGVHHWTDVKFYANGTCIVDDSVDAVQWTQFGIDRAWGKDATAVVQCGPVGTPQRAFTVQDVLDAVATLEAHNVPPDANGEYTLQVSPADARRYRRALKRWRRERKQGGK